MFNNIGGKIKGLAKFICAFFMISSIIGGIVVMCIDDDLILPGILGAIAGCIISWVSCFFVYGFGELVENSDIIANRNTYQPPMGGFNAPSAPQQQFNRPAPGAPFGNAGAQAPANNNNNFNF